MHISDIRKTFYSQHRSQNPVITPSQRQMKSMEMFCCRPIYYMAYIYFKLINQSSINQLINQSTDQWSTNPVVHADSLWLQLACLVAASIARFVVTVIQLSAESRTPSFGLRCFRAQPKVSLDLWLRNHDSWIMPCVVNP